MKEVPHPSDQNMTSCDNFNDNPSNTQSVSGSALSKRTVSTIDKEFPIRRQPGRRRESVPHDSGQIEKHCCDNFDFQKVNELILNINLLGVLFLTLWSLGLTAIVQYALDENLKNMLDGATASIGIMGVFLSFGSVLRINVCYDRWWEARSAWGKLVYATIHCAQQGKSWIADDELSSRFVIMNIIFAYASKALLRDNSLKSKEEEGPSFVSSGLIQQEELDFIHAQPGWDPYYCIDAMRAIMNASWSQKDGCTLQDTGARQAAYQALEDTLRDLALSVGPCIKVKSTGLPVSYNTFVKTLLFIFLTGASLVWSIKLKWATPVIICVMYCLVNLTITIGDNLQKPFGSSFAGLPLQKYCAIIENQLSAIDERQYERSCLATGNCAGTK